MSGIEIFTQNSKQILNIIVKTQPRVFVDLKGPVNERFNQPHFVAKGCRAYKICKQAREGLFAVYGGVRELWGFVRLLLFKST